MPWIGNSFHRAIRLFLESVRFQETRDYIRSIYEIYTIYRQALRDRSGK